MTHEIRYPFTSIPRPHPVFWLGAYRDKVKQIEIPCDSEPEAVGCGKALELHGYEIRIRTGARLPDSIEGENE